jgi:alkanesulfonate monooxygenase SsuD/methylene tetrahydromethanopterin reductase-like flavin-dependent oxidoreductase (luciferase family)
MTGLGLLIQVQAGLPDGAVEAAARAAEAAGCRTLWVNNPPGQDGLAILALSARATDRLPLGTAVIPVSQHPPAAILRRAAELEVPRERCRLGIGSGSARHPVQRVREALEELRPAGWAELAVGALGPSMCRLAGEAADAVILNAVTPPAAARSAERVRDAAEAAGRPAPRVYAVVMAGIGTAARAQLKASSRFLGQLPQYAAHFARLGIAPEDTMLAVEDEPALAAGLAAWSGVVDEVVVLPALPPGQPEATLRLLETVCRAWRSTG